METISYFDQQLIKNLPLKIQAAEKYYADKIKVKTIEEARELKQKYGNWICKVKMPSNEEFYTITTFKEKWVHSGYVLGQWNELTLIEKTTKTKAKNEAQTGKNYVLFEKDSDTGALAIIKERKTGHAFCTAKP